MLVVGRDSVLGWEWVLEWVLGLDEVEEGIGVVSVREEEFYLSPQRQGRETLRLDRNLHSVIWPGIGS